MHTNRVLAVGLLLLLAAVAVVWQLGLLAGDPAMPAPATPAESAPATAPTSASTPRPADAAGGAALAATAAAARTDERIAAPAAADVDASKPAVVGRVVGPDGQPIARATVVAAPGVAFANANGNFDPDSFDVADFADVDVFDPTRMMEQMREQLGDRAETTTDADGRFRIHAKGATRGVGLRVLARGHAILDRRVERPTEKDLDVGTLSLEKGAVVAGRVLDPRGAPIAGARVTRLHEAEAAMMGGFDLDMPQMAEVEALRGGESALTDDQGRFELAHVRAGELTLRARHTDHPTTKSDPLQVEAGRELRDVLLTMLRGGEIRGVVVGMPADAAGLVVMAAKKPRAEADASGMMGMLGGDVGELLADMGMSFAERTATIGADGAFVLRGLARETYRVWVGRERVGFAGNGASSQRVEVNPGATVELRYDAGVAVTFTAVDARTGAPVEQLWVRDRLVGGGGFADMMAMVPRPGRLGSYPGGEVTVANLRPKDKQKLTLTVEAVGYQRLERAGLELPKSGDLALGTLRLEPAPVVRVTVLADETGQAVAGATVRLATDNEPGDAFMRMSMGGEQSSPRRGRTDRNGVCTLNRVVDGTWKIEVQAKGFAPFVSAAAATTVDGEGEFTARLHVGGAAEVAVRDRAGAPVPDAVVEHTSPSGDVASKKADALGAARFDRLAPGEHRFRIGKAAAARGFMRVNVDLGGDQSADSDGWQVVQIADRAVANLVLVKEPTATLRGVVRENGLPLAGARVAFRENSAAADADREAAEERFGDLMAMAGAGSRSVKVDDDGAYELAELPEGEHRLVVTHKQRAMPFVLPVTVRTGEVVLDIELDMTAVRGSVLDPDGKPVDGARLRVRKVRPAGELSAEDLDAAGDMMESMMPGMGGSSIKSDGNGLFELRGVEPGVELIVEASAKGHAPVATRVRTSAGASVDAGALRLGAAGRVKVTAAGDSPFAGVRARWVGDGAELGAVRPVVQLLRKGKGTLDGLRPGKWELSVEGAGREGDGKRTRVVEVLAGQTIEVDL